MRNRTSSPVLLSLNFGILCRPLTAKMQKWNQSWLWADLIFIPWWCTGLAYFLPFQIFFLFPLPEIWWTSVNSVHTGSHSRSSHRGHRAGHQPQASHPPTPPTPNMNATFPALFSCCALHIWDLALMVRVLLVLASGPYLTQPTFPLVLTACLIGRAARNNCVTVFRVHLTICHDRNHSYR